jgi:hypothetical protein
MLTLQKSNYLHLKGLRINYFPDPSLKLIAKKPRSLKRCLTWLRECLKTVSYFTDIKCTQILRTSYIYGKFSTIGHFLLLT